MQNIKNQNVIRQSVFLTRLPFWLSLLVFAFNFFSALAQTDSTFGPERFFEAVARFHPLVRQANLFNTLAEKELQMNRGQFDPKLGAAFNRKSFDGKDYYNLFNPELKVPTWPGLDIKAGFERNVGTNISSERETPQTGLQYLGFGLPLGQGLFTDVRRTTLKQAKIGLQLADAERQSEINKVLFTAAKDYWDWFFFHRQLQWAQMAYRFANERYLAVRQRVTIGEEAPIDSVEARIFQQDRAIFLIQSQVEEQNSRLQISNYLWLDDGNPVELPQGAKPEIGLKGLQPISDSSLEQMKQLAMARHPTILKINSKLGQLDLEQRLAKEMLKPRLNVHYSWLSRTDNSIWATQSIDRNYKLGADFDIPLFLRKERGKFGMVKTKLLQGKLELLQIQRDIRLEIQTNMNELKTLELLLDAQNQMVENYKKLREGELKKFNNGESSLFLINAREQKLIESQIKADLLIAKYQKARAGVQFAAGRNPLM